MAIYGAIPAYTMRDEVQRVDASNSRRFVTSKESKARRAISGSLGRQDMFVLGLLSMSFKLNLHASDVEGFGRSV